MLNALPSHAICGTNPGTLHRLTPSPETVMPVGLAISEPSGVVGKVVWKLGQISSHLDCISTQLSVYMSVVVMLETSHGPVGAPRSMAIAELINI